MSKVVRSLVFHIKLNKLGQNFQGVCCKRYSQSAKPEIKSDVGNRLLGQPSSFSHPFLMKEGEVTPGLTKKDFALRRQSLINKICSEKLDQASTEEDEKNWDPNREKNEHVMIIMSSPTTYMTQDIPYVFHQNTNFLYLTGFMEPNSCLILETIPGKPHPEFKSTLFVQKRDPVMELWHGARSGVDGSIYHTGINEADEMENFGEYLNKFVNEKYTIWYEYNRMTNLELHMKYMTKFLGEITKCNQTVRLPSEPIHEKRLFKSENELSLMLMAAEITAVAFKESMSMSYPGINEAGIYARLEYATKMRGGLMLAYPPVVAGGNRANTLHYVANDQNIEDGSLVLVDAGAHYHGYACDVTRTWPINGKFTEVQKLLYEAILRIQRHCIQMCKPGETLDNIYNVMTLMLAHEMYEVGVLKDKYRREQLIQIIRRLCPHHVGHWLGMDIHDTPNVSRSTPLKAGMIVTIEPGVYLREDDELIPQEFRGIGIRIEDDILITNGDMPYILTKSCPKSVEEIEQIMNKN